MAAVTKVSLIGNVLRSAEIKGRRHHHAVFLFHSATGAGARYRFSRQACARSNAGPRISPVAGSLTTNAGLSPGRAQPQKSSSLDRVRDPPVGHLLHRGFAVCLLQALPFGTIVEAIKISKGWNKQTRILLQRTDTPRKQS